MEKAFSVEDIKDIRTLITKSVPFEKNIYRTETDPLWTV